MAGHTGLNDLMGSLGLGSGKRGDGGGRGGGASGDSGRHNIGRVPELDYFARKLAGTPTPLKWKLPYGKAGHVAPGGLPDVHTSRPLRHLCAAGHPLHQGPAGVTTMQAHTALEFQAAAESALAAAEGRNPEPAQLWWPFAKKSSSGSAWRAVPAPRRSFQLDFSDDGDPWIKHLVHVKETDSYHVARKAYRCKDSGNDILVLLPTVACADGSRLSSGCHMRSLGFMGSFLLQYSSAQALRFELRNKNPRPGALLFLELVADPRKQQTIGASSCTLRCGPLHLLPDVPINTGQREAVAGLGGGLSIIHGPPGTGKSTTIFHIIESRVQPKAQVLVTATRNQAIDAVVTKLSRVEGSLLVFGHEKRVGDNAKRFLLDERVKRHPHIASWLEHVRQLQALRDSGGVRRSAPERALQAAVAQPNGAGDADLSRLRGLQDKLHQGTYAELVGDILQPAISQILAKILPAVKAAAARSILESTRVYACTIDSTPRMVWELEDAGVKVHIDTVIVDEAGCVSEMALPTLINLAPSQLVLIGDHLQLPAYTDLHKPPPNYTRSLMQHAVEQGLPAAMLCEQYRMHPAICEAVSRQFYSGRLNTAPATARRRAVPAPCRMLHVKGGAERWHAAAGYDNTEEAFAPVRAAVKAAKELRGIGVQRPTLFIISMYNKQRDLITRLVQTSKHGAKLRALCSSCQVLSVDACQGDEADAVVVSAVRNVFSSKDRSLSSFFRDEQRINVAMSRARYMCVLCGHRGTLALPKAQPWGHMLDSYSGSD